MQKFIINENQLMLLESFSDKVQLVKKYLDNNFARATFEKDGEEVGIFVKTRNGIPTDKSYWRQDVIDILDKEFHNIITDKTERVGFLNQIVKDWYNRTISKFGSLTSYKFRQ